MHPEKQPMADYAGVGIANKCKTDYNYSEYSKKADGRHYELSSSEKLTDEDKVQFKKLLQGKDDTVEDSIRKLSKLLYKHYGQKTIIIIDEYDVPLDKAFQNGYYKEMVSLIRGLFGQALKTNNNKA